MEAVDLRTGARASGVDLLFPGWKPDETVVFLSPHDDDVVLGAGYLVLAVREAGGRPVVAVLCRGDAGYSRASDKAGIAARRRKEAVAAYGRLGVPARDLVFFGLPDLSLMSRVDRVMADGRRGVVDRLIRLLRAKRAARVVFSSPHFENWDHTAVHRLGMYVVPQAGDPILADLGPPSPVRSLLVYSVWGDFEPRGTDALRADLALLAGDRDEELVRSALAAFVSQKAIMDGTAAGRRDQRRGPDGWLELYQRAVPREPIAFGPYFRELRKS